MKITGNAGHSFITPGKCTPDGMKEFEFNVAVFNYFKQEIEQYSDRNGEKVSVIAVHDPSGKIDISLKKRSDYVNRLNPDLHIDFHANAYGNGLTWNDANGVETFVYKKTLKEAVKVANAVQKEIVVATKLRDRGVKEGNLHMVREPKCPAILIEGPFMTNKNEAEKLKSDSFRKLFASAIVKGVVAAYGLKLVKQKKHRLITGTYATEEAAKRAERLIKNNNIASYTEIKKDGNYYRVQTGTYANKEDAETASDKIKSLKIASYVNIVEA